MNLSFFKLSPTEYEIQRVAHNVLAEAYPTVRGELKLKRDNLRGCRFDLVVFDYDGTMLFTVEVKDNPKVKKHSKKIYYEHIATVPNVLIAGMEQALNAFQVVNEQLKNR
jgi:hypothetical protein